MFRCIGHSFKELQWQYLNNTNQYFIENYVDLPNPEPVNNSIPTYN